MYKEISYYRITTSQNAISQQLKKLNIWTKHFPPLTSPNMMHCFMRLPRQSLTDSGLYVHSNLNGKFTMEVLTGHSQQQTRDWVKDYSYQQAQLEIFSPSFFEKLGYTLDKKNIVEQKKEEIFISLKYGLEITIFRKIAYVRIIEKSTQPITQQNCLSDWIFNKLRQNLDYNDIRVHNDSVRPFQYKTDDINNSV